MTGLLLTLACSGQDVAQVDVAQVEVSAFSAARGILVQELRIDGYAEDLLPIVGLAVAADGTIAITQSIDQAIRFFSDDGMPLGAFGRRGQGPGEFTAMGRLGWLADSLSVYDLRQGRVTVISPELSLVRTVRVPPRAIPGPGVPGGSTVPFVSPLALVANDELLAILSFNPARLWR